MTTVPILLYHSVSADPAPWIAPLAVTPDTWARHVDVIAASGRTVMPLAGLVEALLHGTPLPERPAVITFDDGFADFAQHAAPLLAERGLPSMLYVTTGALRDGPGVVGTVLPRAAMLSWGQVAELEEQGVEIGAHSHTHRQLDLLTRSAARTEIRRPKDLLEDALGHAVGSFAYPYGWFRPSVRQMVRDAGYSSACAVMNALSSSRDERFSIARLTVTRSTTPERLHSWLAGGRAAIAPYPQRLRTRAWRLYRYLRTNRAYREAIDLPQDGMPPTLTAGPTRL